MPSYHAFFLLGQLGDLRPLPAVDTEDATYRAIALIPFLLVRRGVCRKCSSIASRMAKGMCALGAVGLNQADSAPLVILWVGAGKARTISFLVWDWHDVAGMQQSRTNETRSKSAISAVPLPL